MSEKSDLVLNETAEELDKIIAALKKKEYDPEDTIFKIGNGTKFKLLSSDYDAETSTNSIYVQNMSTGETGEMTEAQMNSVKSLTLGTDMVWNAIGRNGSGDSFLFLAKDDVATPFFPNLKDLTLQGSLPQNMVLWLNDSCALSSITFKGDLSAYQSQYMCSNLKNLTFNGSVYASYENYAVFESDNIRNVSLPLSGNLTLKSNNGGLGGFIKSTSESEMSKSWIVFPAELNLELDNHFTSLHEATFEGRTMEEVQAMTNYPWEMNSGAPAIIHCSDGAIELDSSGSYDGGGGY